MEPRWFDVAAWEAPGSKRTGFRSWQCCSRAHRGMVTKIFEPCWLMETHRRRAGRREAHSRCVLDLGQRLPPELLRREASVQLLPGF